VSFTVLFEPSATAVEVEPGRTLLEAARDAEIPLGATCGGRGTCGKCQVRIQAGPLPPPGEHERDALSAGALAEGWRLACRYAVTAPVTAETFFVRTRAKGDAPPLERPFDFSPPIRRWDVDVTPPSLERPEDDAGNLCAALARAGAPAVQSVDYQVSRELPEALRSSGWSVAATVRGAELTGVRPRLSARAPLGLAVDLGTTNIAAYLYALDTGALSAVCSAANPLSSYGADIISRLTWGAESPAHREELQRVAVKAVNRLAEHAARERGGTREDIEEMVVVGNSGMHHLFLGLPGRQLMRAPFVPALRAAVSIKARDLGIEIARGGYVHLPPLVGGFVGSDLLAVALSTRMDARPGIRLALDIGTNTELLLSVNGALHCCSTASGPALEGAALRFGTVAAPGAVESVQVNGTPGGLSFRTLENKPANGICGSGIIDALSCLRRLGDISHTGRMRTGSPRVRADDGGDHRFVLAPAAQTALGEDLTISQAEVRSLQLAKGAIRAGIGTLLALHGLEESSLDELLIAGTFGNHLHVQSAVEIGLFPAIPRDRIRQIGNAAGAGAVLMLLSVRERSEAAALSRSIMHVELSLQAGFRKRFARAQWFPEELP
jgi:uncharacterized 2Fe-2S/4Fe-4S cluster protein (DUF4445 family)